MGFDGDEIIEREKRRAAQKLKQEADAEKRRKNSVPWWQVALVFVGMALFIFYKIGDENSGTTKATIETGSGHYVSEQEYGAAWPFTIPSGTLNCTSKDVQGYQKQYVSITHNGKTWAVNGSARGNDDYRPLDEIWKNNPEDQNAKVPPSEIIQRGLKLCRGN